MPVVAKTVLLLICSNIFMTFAWYAHLRNLSQRPWIVAALVSWGIALFEYLLQVPANRIGHTALELGRLKIIQEVITLSVFVPFAVFYMKEPVRLNYLWADCVSAAQSSSCSADDHGSRSRAAPPLPRRHCVSHAESAARRAAALRDLQRGQSRPHAGRADPSHGVADGIRPHVFQGGHVSGGTARIIRARGRAVSPESRGRERAARERREVLDHDRAAAAGTVCRYDDAPRPAGHAAAASPMCG